MICEVFDKGVEVGRRGRRDVRRGARGEGRGARNFVAQEGEILCRQSVE